MNDKAGNSVEFVSDFFSSLGFLLLPLAAMEVFSIEKRTKKSVNRNILHHEDIMSEEVNMETNRIAVGRSLAILF